MSEYLLKAARVIAFTDRSIRLELTAQDQEKGSHGFMILNDEKTQVVLRRYRGKLLGLGQTRSLVISVPFDQLPAQKNQAKFDELTQKLGNLNAENVKFVDLLEIRGGVADIGSYSACMYTCGPFYYLHFEDQPTRNRSNFPATMYRSNHR